MLSRGSVVVVSRYYRNSFELLGTTRLSQIFVHISSIMPYGKTDHRPFLPTPVRFGRILFTPSCTRWLYFLAALSATFCMFLVVDYLQRATAEANVENHQNYDATFTKDISTSEYGTNSVELVLDFVNSLGSQRQLEGSGYCDKVCVDAL